MGVLIKGKTTYGPKVVTNGLVLYLDAANPKSYSGSGTIWNDLTNYKNTSTLTNPQFSQENKGYFTFTLESNSSLAYKPQYDIRSGITFGVYIKRLSTYNQLTDQFILSRHPSWYFYDYWNSGSIRGDVFINTVRVAGINSPIIPFDGNWYYVVYTYNSVNATAKMYVNGEYQSAKVESGLTNTLIDSSTNDFITIGSTGHIDRKSAMPNLMIYNRTLTDSEILQNYNALKNRFNQ
jgi:hypothetical protein